AILVTGAVMVGVYTILEVGDHGWTSTHTLGFGAAAIALLAGFVVREARAATPLIPLRVFRSRALSGASLTIVLMVAGMFGMFFLGVLYLQRILDYDAVETGLAFLPVSMLIGILSLGVSARLNLRFGARATLVPGLVLVAVALAYFSRAPVDGDYVTDVLPVVVLLGAGAGLVLPSLTTISMAGVLPGDAGLASGVVNTSMQVGGAFGLAVLATLASDRTETLRANGDSVAAALTGGYQLAFLVAAGLIGAAILLATVLLRSEPPVAVMRAHGSREGQPYPEAA
ncbi:MAG: MFS transporter, partial [Actinomycetota bacterium]|nr:MFS transporter [Actinomycetota bacterium]